MAVDVESLYRTHGPMVLRRCRKLLRDDGKALDAMHDVFVEITRRASSLSDEAPAALLLRTATNVCLNRLRTDRRHPEDRDDEMLMHIAGAGGDAESLTAARGLLQRIFGGEQESTLAMAVMHYVDRMTLDEVAAEVGMSVSGVRKRLRTLKARVPELPREEVLS